MQRIESKKQQQKKEYFWFAKFKELVLICKIHLMMKHATANFKRLKFVPVLLLWGVRVQVKYKNSVRKNKVCLKHVCDFFLWFYENKKDARRPYDHFGGGIAPRSLLCVRKQRFPFCEKSVNSCRVVFYRPPEQSTLLLHEVHTY